MRCHGITSLAAHLTLTASSIAIWTSRRDPESGDWGESAKLAFTDLRYNDVDPFVSRDGSRLFFSSNRPRPDAGADAPSEDMNTWVSARMPDGSRGRKKRITETMRLGLGRSDPGTPEGAPCKSGKGPNLTPVLILFG